MPTSNTPNIIRDVTTGRRMKSRDGFIAKVFRYLMSRWSRSRAGRLVQGQSSALLDWLAQPLQTCDFGQPVAVGLGLALFLAHHRQLHSDFDFADVVQRECRSVTCPDHL